MRITGGRARGITLQSPKTNATRPATDYLREALYSSIGGTCAARTVVDLYAGSGAYGLEALSRGASRVVFVENDPRALKCLAANILKVCKSLKINDPEYQTRIIKKDVCQWLEQCSDQYEIVIADPPYAILPRQGTKILEQAFKILNIHQKSFFVLEAPGEFEIVDLPEGFKIKKRILRGPKQPSILIIEPISP